MLCKAIEYLSTHIIGPHTNLFGGAYYFFEKINEDKK